MLKEISPEYSLKVLKLKRQYFGLLTLEKTLMLGGIWVQEKKGTTEDEMAV